MLASALREFFGKHDIAPCHIIAAASGGVDSTALLLALCELRDTGFTVTCGHVNHHLRGDDSDADEAFVRELCDQLSVTLRTADGTLPPEAIKQRGIEAAARDVRFAQLQKMRSEAGAHYLATAHQKNDQAETVLMRLFTGGGIAALRGIHPIRDDGVIRPLLEVRREAIEEFLARRDITPRFDRSNIDPRFVRNRIRQMLRALEPSVVDSVATMAEQARVLWPLVERRLDEIERDCAEIEPERTRFHSLPSDPWLRQALLHRHIFRLDPDARDVSAADLIRLAAEAKSIRRVSVTRTLELRRHGDHLLLERVPDRLSSLSSVKAPRFELEVTTSSPRFIPELRVRLSITPVVSPSRYVSEDRLTQIIELPPDAEPRFIVRNRREGDRFQPLGSTAPKKLKDFLIDRKIAAESRDEIPLLIWNEEIVWIAGVEVSERFKVNRATGNLFELRLERLGATGE